MVGSKSVYILHAELMEHLGAVNIPHDRLVGLSVPHFEKTFYLHITCMVGERMVIRTYCS